MSPAPEQGRSRACSWHTAPQAEGTTRGPAPPHGHLLRAEKAWGSRSYPLLLRQLDCRTPPDQSSPPAHGHHRERRSITTRTRQGPKASTPCLPATDWAGQPRLIRLSGLQSVYERQGIAVMTPTVPGSPKGPFLGLPRGTMRRQKSIGKQHGHAHSGGALGDPTPAHWRAGPESHPGSP